MARLSQGAGRLSCRHLRSGKKEMKAVSTIRLRSTGVICAVMLALIVAYASAAYRQMKETTIQAVGERMEGGAEQLATILGTQAGRMKAQISTLAEEESVEALL